MDIDLSKLKHSLFKVRQNQVVRPSDVTIKTVTEETDSILSVPQKDADIEDSISDADIEDMPSDILLYAVTINICPNKYMNKKKWSTYSHDQQRKILSRVENSFRRKTPSVELKKLVFEECPTLKQIHYHALYRMPSEHKSEMETYFLKRVNMPGVMRDPSKAWRAVRIDPIFDEDGWLEYITKTHEKQ